MDKTKVKVISAPYSPPLSPSQLEAIATEMVKLSAEEAPELTRRKSRRS